MTPSINLSTYQQGSTLFLYWAVLSRIVNSLSANIQLDSNSPSLLPIALLSLNALTMMIIRLTYIDLTSTLQVSTDLLLQQLLTAKKQSFDLPC